MTRDPTHDPAAGPAPDLRPADDEDLAAFAEGRLDPARRPLVLERLAVDEDYYELYAELLRFMEEEPGADESTEPERPPTDPSPGPSPGDPSPGDPSPGDPPPGEAGSGNGDGGKVVTGPPRWWRLRRPLVGLAAAAVLVAIIAPRLLLTPPALDRLAIGLDPADLVEVPGPTFRDDGGDDSPEYRLGAGDSFLLGALLLDAEVAALGEDPAVAETRRGRAASLLAKHPYLVPIWRECEDDALPSGCVEPLIDSGQVDAFALRRGTWSRATWLAIRSGDLAYVEAPQVSKGLAALARAAPDAEAAASLQAQRRSLAAGDLEALREAIERDARASGATFHDSIDE